MGKLSKAVGVAGVVTGTAYLSKSENRRKVKGQLDKFLRNFDRSYVKNLGKPADFDDSKMVGEGALTSVQYYNRMQQKSENPQ